MKRNEKELIEYIILFLGLITFFILLVIFRYEAFALRMVALLGSLFYIVWGIIHHAADDRLTLSVILEYVSISILVFLLFFFVLSS